MGSRGLAWVSKDRLGNMEWDAFSPFIVGKDQILYL